MGFLTRLLAGLTAAAALGTGLTGTANAVDVTGATGNTKSVVKLTADDTNNLPDHIVNGSFDYPSVPSWTGLAGSSSNKFNKGKRFATINPGTGKYGSGCAMSTTGRAIPNWNRSSFAWNSTQGDTHYPGMSCEAGNVELNYDSVHHNQFAELTADQQGTAIYQDVKVTPGTMMKWSLKHSSATSAYVDKMQVMIGEPYKETAQEATRITSENGNKVGEKMTTISTPTTSDRADNKKWDTYSGAYLVPDGVTTVRFTFKSVASAEWYSGNDLDDIEFSRSYKLTYDKNSSDAAGEVPSNQRGKENTVQPAASKTNGTVKTVAGENVRYGSLANGDFSYPSFSDIQKNEQETPADLRTFLKSDDGTLWYNISNTDLSKYGKIGQIPGFDSSRFAWSSTENGSRVELQQDRNTKNTYAEIVAQQDNTSIYQNVSTGNGGVLYKIRLKHASRQSSHADRMQVLVGSDTDHATPVEMTRVTSNGHGDKVGGKSTIITTKVSNTDPRDHGAQWETYEGYYQVPEGQKNTVFMFKSLEGFKEDETLSGNNVGNLVDDIEFSRSYKLTYDANSSDASGQVPSDTAANTVKQAKSKTNGSVRLAADDDVAEYAANGLPKQLVNSDFDHDWRNIVSQSKMTGKYNFANVDPAHGDVEISGGLNSKGEASKQWVHLNGFDAARFGWKSNQTDTRVDGRGGIVEIQRSKANDNMYAEITASQANTYLYQDIDTAHSTPTVYTVKLRYAHRNGTINSNEKIQILVGAPSHEQPVEMTRIASDRGNRLGEKSTTVNAPNTDGWLGSWDTFQGSVVVPAGQNVSRFTFKALGSIDGISGNLIDDVQFKLAYKLSYDKNANDASGSVPSDETANTVKQAKAKTTGTVRAVADRTASGLTVHDLKKGDIAPAQYGDFKFSTLGNLDANQITDVEGFTVKDNWFPVDNVENPNYVSYLPSRDGATLTLKHVGEWVDSSGVKQWINARLIVNNPDAGCLYYERQTRSVGMGIGKWHASASSRPYLDMSVEFLLDDGTTPQGLRGVTGFTDLDGGTSGYNEGVELVSDFDGAYVRSDAHLTRFGTNGWAGNTDENANASDSHGMKHYLGATFTGSSIRVRYSVTAGQLRGSLFQPVDSTIAFRLTYDKNAQDAAGQVPSDTTANTVKQAKAKTTGTVRAVADRTASGLTVHDLKNGEIAPAQYGDFKFSTTDGVTADQITDVNGFTVKTNWNPTVENQAYAGRILGTMYQPNRNGASLVLHHVGQWRDSSGTQRWLNAKITVNGQNLGSLVYYESQHKFLASYGKWDRHTSSRPYMDVTVDFLLDDGSTPQGLRGVTGFTDLDGGTSGYNEGVELVSGFDGAYVRSDAHLARFGTNGWAGITDENENNADAHGMKHYVGATFTGLSFRVRWSVASGQARGSGFQPVDSTIAYRLTYDKNAQDATGSIPSDTAADTIRPAKSETDGKVSDLVQRTTTHEDGSVTVKTIDTSTDVVSGCQVYYPAGQRITLATMAKDDDCWDSSMLSRPGHTQLGWNQDRNATQAQAQVTMVEGGMTVYAVWVGNPVLTYDTNKPSTWSGQMPSTPASVSVAYNTAAADGSGWRAGDTTKIRGYRFLGWYTGPQDNAGLYDWTRPLTGSVTVYAHWQRLQANVVYNANGGTGSHPNTTGWQYSDVTIPGDTSKSFKRTGYRFAGWNTAKDGKGTAYADGGRVPLQGKDVTLYAQWAPLFDVLPSAGGGYGPSVPWLVCGGLALVALVGGVASTLLRLRRARGAHSR